MSIFRIRYSLYQPNYNPLYLKIFIFLFISGIIGVFVAPFFGIELIENLVPLLFWIAGAFIFVYLANTIFVKFASPLLSIGIWVSALGIVFSGLASISISDVPILSDTTLMAVISYLCYSLAFLIVIVRVAQLLTSDLMALNVMIWSVVVGIAIYIVDFTQIAQVTDVIDAKLLENGYLIAFGVAVISFLVFIFQIIFMNKNK